MLEKLYKKIIDAQHECKSKVISNNLVKLTTLADEGDSDAQFWLAQVYAYPGQLNDDVLAFKWWKASAKNDNPRAQYVLGMSYAQGVDVEQDVKKGIGYLKKAASQGNAESMLLLEEIYAEYEGHINPKQAEKYKKMASELGYERDAENDEQLADLLGKFDELMGEVGPVEVGMVEHHQVNYHYKFVLNVDVIKGIYGIDEDRALEILNGVISGEITVDRIMADASSASVDIDWEFDGEDNWTSRKGGYDVTYKINDEN